MHVRTAAQHGANRRAAIRSAKAQSTLHTIVCACTPSVSGTVRTSRHCQTNNVGDFKCPPSCSSFSYCFSSVRFRPGHTAAAGATDRPDFLVWFSSLCWLWRLSTAPQYKEKRTTRCHALASCRTQASHHCPIRIRTTCRSRIRQCRVCLSLTFPFKTHPGLPSHRHNVGGCAQLRMQKAPRLAAV